MRIGGSVMKPYSNEKEWLKHVKELNYSTVIFPVDSASSKQAIQNYAKCAEENDLLIGEVGVWRNCMSPDKQERENHIAYAIRQLELAESVKAKCCVNISGSVGALWDGYHAYQGTKGFYDEVVETTQRIIDAVNPQYTCFSLEPMPWMTPESPEEYLQLIKDVDRKAFKVHLDYANMINSIDRYRDSDGFIRKCFNLLAPYIRSVHAKDLLIKDQILPVCIEEVPPGQGSIHMSLALECVKQIDEEIPVFVEHLANHKEYLAASAYMHALAKQIS